MLLACVGARQFYDKLEKPASNEGRRSEYESRYSLFGILPESKAGMLV